ncbi:MAG: hypothetical protein J6P61_02895 [Erysipelotrichaceae bacterium]|nr:hypothetical protein [Erysipelotrichaceae bacterium]
MLKRIICILLLALVVGCSPKKADSSITPDQSDVSIVQNDDSSVVQTEETTENTTEEEPAKDVVAKYNLKSGEYYNSPEGGTPYMCEAVIKQLDSSSFEFTFYQICDEKGNHYDEKKLIFKTHVAEFDDDEATTAIYHGKQYTLTFKCDYEYSFKLSGFKNGMRCSDTYSRPEAGSIEFGN